MILRIWRTQVEPAEAAAYLEFARGKSLPMFREQRGFRGVFFTTNGADRAVVTLWDDVDAVDALAGSQTYAQTASAIEQAGFLRGDSTVELFEVEDRFLLEGGSG